MTSPCEKNATPIKNPPYDNCSFRLCDLPGQCRGEGKCHHPNPAATQQDELSRLSVAIYTAAQRMGIANADHTSLSASQCLHLLECMVQDKKQRNKIVPELANEYPAGGLEHLRRQDFIDGWNECRDRVMEAIEPNTLQYQAWRSTDACLEFIDAAMKAQAAQLAQTDPEHD